MTDGGDDDAVARTPVERAKAAFAALRADGDAPSRCSRSTTALMVTVTPGRVNLIGGHADYNDGLCLPTAADRHVAVAVRSRSNDLLHVRAANFDETVEPAPDDDPKGWAACAAAVTRVLREEDPISGTDLATASDVPMGAGLSSSAALGLAVDRTFLAVSGRDLPAADLVLIYRRAEREGIDVEYGILGQLSAALCETDSAFSLDCWSRETEPVPLDDGVSTFVIDTGVSHELTESSYGNCVREYTAALDTLCEDTSHDLDSLRDVDRDLLDTRADALGPVHFRRVQHIVTENERVCRARDALAAGGLDHVGDAMLTVHDSLRDNYEVSCPELGVAVEFTAGIPGVYGARMIGGDFGGGTIALADDDVLDQAERAVRDTAPERIGSDADVFVCRPPAGIRLAGEE